MGQRLGVAGAQPLEFTVGVAVTLKISDEALRAGVAPMQKLQPGVDLCGDALAPIQVDRRKAGVVAKRATPGADQTVAIRAGEARKHRHLLHPAPMTRLHVVVPGVVAAFAKGRAGGYIHPVRRDRAAPTRHGERLGVEGAMTLWK